VARDPKVYLKTHHPMRMTREVVELREGGGMTCAEVAKALGIGATTLRRMEGDVYERLPRRGKRGMRVFTTEVIAQIRQHLSGEDLARRTPPRLQLVR
jgi:hypothetical protein